METVGIVIAVVVIVLLAAIGFVTALNWLFEWHICRGEHGWHIHQMGCWSHGGEY